MTKKQIRYFDFNEVVKKYFNQYEIKFEVNKKGFITDTSLKDGLRQLNYPDKKELKLQMFTPSQTVDFYAPNQDKIKKFLDFLKHHPRNKSEEKAKTIELQLDENSNNCFEKATCSSSMKISPSRSTKRPYLKTENAKDADAVKDTVEMETKKPKVAKTLMEMEVTGSGSVEEELEKDMDVSVRDLRPRKDPKLTRPERYRDHTYLVRPVSVRSVGANLANYVARLNGG